MKHIFLPADADVIGPKRLSPVANAVLLLLLIPIPLTLARIPTVISAHPSDMAANVLIDLLAMVFCYVLMVTCVLTIHTSDITYALFLHSVAVEYLYICADTVIHFLIPAPGHNGLLLVLMSLVYFFGTLEVFFFWLYSFRCFGSGRTERILTLFLIVFTSVYTALILVNPFYTVFFSVTPEGYIAYRNQDLLTTMFLSVDYCVFLLYILTRKCALRKKLAFTCYTLTPLVMILISLALISRSADRQQSYDALTLFIILIPLYLVFFRYFADQQRKLLSADRALNDARVDLMLSQIQPHFIYNSLTAIIGLIDIDPEQAKYSIVSFSDYLRVNLEALKEVKLIPFEKELEHCRTYLQFEQLRFDDLRVEYDIAARDFYLPVLTVQPIVENAVKHGVSANRDGGTVRLSTADRGSFVEIRVEDNGVGFDASAAELGDSHHVGLANVRSRLAAHGGTLRVESGPEQGTCVTIQLPKTGGQNDEDFSA